jgi:hypothetical protein
VVQDLAEEGARRGGAAGDDETHPGPRRGRAGGRCRSRSS